MSRLNLLWHASRHDSDAEAAYLLRTLRWMGRRRRRPAVIGLGEMQTPEAIDAVATMLSRRGYRTARGDEYFVAWDPRHAKPRGKDFTTLRRMSNVFAGREKWRNPDMLTARFKAASGAPFNVDLLHANAGIEWGDDYRKGPDSDSHRAVYAKYRGVLGRRRKGVVSILMDDSNADQGRASWRVAMRAATGLASMWDTTTRLAGTHRNWGAKAGRRVIDRISSTAPIVRGGPCPWPRPDEHLDHRAIWATVALPAPAVRKK